MCVILDGDPESGLYECWEGLCGDTCVSGMLCSEGGGDLFRWGMLGSVDW